MLCPYCNKDNDKVIDSRAAESGGTIRRRRECVDCGKRIPFERLIIEPQALRCVACGSKREARKPA